MRERSFVDTGASNSDPPGIQGQITTPSLLKVEQFSLNFPNCPSVSIKTKWVQPTVGFIDGKQIPMQKAPLKRHEVEICRFGFHQLGLEFGKLGQVEYLGEPISFKVSQSRFSLYRRSELIWTWRHAWTDAEAKAKVVAVVFVEKPERFEDDLPLWLLLALNFHLTRRILAATGDALHTPWPY